MRLIKVLSIKNVYLKLLIVLISFNLVAQRGLAVDIEKKENTSCIWTLTAYNFGGLENLSPKEQVNLLNEKGFSGIILRGATKENVQNLDVFINEADKIEDFNIQSVFIRYNFQDSETDKNHWKKVLGKIAGSKIQLWVIFGKKTDGINDAFVEAKLQEITSFCKQNGVEVILYPHSKCYIESAEEALRFVEKLNQPNLKLSFHLYHEIRAGNGSRINEVFANVQNWLGAVTMAGTDSVADYSKPKAMDKSTIKPLGQGNFKMKQFLEPLHSSGYSGPVGFMNFKIEEEPEIYLESSIREWKRLNNYITAVKKIEYE